ncbi:Eco57I restriction-modification methylase domain-containing protein [Haloferula sp. A504]|uniref:Eco57I restriction-modification methylase domain-containing protein n=1 Tax=Haloferula sp. A504 TaxID=3373601 RepID=UPI0031CC036E|nr:N-6 DNA methylase [Verrucomicrobiaceae bacterium E54]
MPAPDAVKRLVENFENNREHYRSAAYNETQLRRQFLDPFWEALGWDVNNREGNAPAYTDVIHEASIKIRGGTRAPDYAFSINGGLNPSAWKFFVEAKAPCVNLKDHPDPALQVRRYGWSAKLALSVLSDFEEFAAYDCRIRPRPGDKAATARTLYFTYDQYEDRWEEIADIFSREAVRKGSFDRYAEGSKKKRGTAEVDDAFLAEIERWRELLARNFALRNPDLSVLDLNFAVQKTIDRLIFLRICEDRGTEDYGRLLTLANGANTYPRLLEHFRRADDRYNSGLFHFRDESGRPGAPDQLTPDLRLDDKALKDILKNLYYPESPYEFSVLPADILGQVYEQFLGKTIRLTPAHQAKIEEKPEVRKAGGVYYTPKYIVDYIVENTLGRLLNGPNPEKPKPIPVSQAEKLKVLDPACGSGSFLIVAYQFLLDWHLDQYTLGPERKPDVAKIKRHAGGKHPRIYQAKGGEWRLTTAEKKRILLNNIHGVDIDSQAVEVTKLSLLLKVLEGETEQVVQRDFLKERQRILPDLGHNIRCGNSLIGPDFYDQPDLPELDDETRYRINVFDWETAFPEVFEQGGFDCVIGNPPYLSIDDVWGNKDPKLRYLKHGFPEVYNDKTDLLFYFLALALRVSSGTCGMIVSRAFLEAFKADKLRRQLTNSSRIREIIDFRDFMVFEGVGIATAIIVTDQPSAGNTDAFHFQATGKLPDLRNKRGPDFKHYSRDLNALGSKPWIFGSTETLELYRKVDSNGQVLGEICHIGQGMQTGANSVFGKLSGSEIEEFSVPESLFFSRATNSDIQRFSIRNRGEKTLYLEEIRSFDDLPKSLQNYLTSNSEKLRGRAAFRRGNCDWWRFTWPLHREHYSKRRILCPYLATHNRFGLDAHKEYLGLTDTTVIFEPEPGGEDLLYLLGLLNSKLLTVRFRGIGKLKGGGIYEYFENTVSKLPIRRIDFTNPADVEVHDKMVSLVERMLKLHEDKASEKNPESLRRLEEDIAITDRRIDRLVYELYGLTADEIALVEGAKA